jgi:hypothetical protein
MSKGYKVTMSTEEEAKHININKTTGLLHVRKTIQMLKWWSKLDNKFNLVLKLELFTSECPKQFSFEQEQEQIWKAEYLLLQCKNTK